MKTKTVHIVSFILLCTSLFLLWILIWVRNPSVRTFVQNPLAVLTALQADAVSARQLKELLKNKKPASPAGGFTLINVHTPYDGEIEKTDTFIPYDQIVANSASLPKDKNAAIILYCKTGRMSSEALPVIKKLGYTNVRHVTGGMDAWRAIGQKTSDLSNLDQDVTPDAGIELPIQWRELPAQLLAAGVIDQEKLTKIVQPSDEQLALFTQSSGDNIKITKENGKFIVDMLWGIGLAQKSIVYTEGPMGKENKKDAGNFASTGGWTLARGNAMQYLNRFDLIPLTADQQQKVAEIAKNVYRPCCGNSTWFPDCNHGMAALAAIEMMVSANVDEKTIYRKVLALNSYWFADSYLTIATYFARQGTPWDKVDAKEVLGAAYSSSQGARDIAKKVGPLPYRPVQSGGSCGA